MLLTLSKDYDSWLEGFDDVVSQLAPQPGSSLRMADAVSMMKDYFQWKSLASAPSTRHTQYSWFSAPPQLISYDNDVMNILLNTAKRHLAETFAILSPFEARPDSAEEVVLAMAAVGALFRDAGGSDRVAKACYNDARRIALAKVSPPLAPIFTSKSRARLHQTHNQIPPIV